MEEKFTKSLIIKHSSCYVGYYIAGVKNRKKIKRIIIPQQYKGEPVTRIACNAFRNCKNLIDVVIPEGILSIDSQAFRECSILSLKIPNTVQLIGSSAFYNCKKLKSITLQNGLESISCYAFYGCSDLTDIQLPNTVKDIGSGAFQECISLPKITIPDNVKEIEEYTFCNCKNLRDVKIPEGIKNIHSTAFLGCDAIDIQVTKRQQYFMKSIKEIVSAQWLYENRCYCFLAAICKLINPNWYVNCYDLSIAMRQLNTDLLFLNGEEIVNPTELDRYKIKFNWTYINDTIQQIAQKYGWSKIINNDDVMFHAKYLNNTVVVLTEGREGRQSHYEAYHLKDYERSWDVIYIQES